MDEDLEDNLFSGGLTASDYDVLTSGNYAAAQDPYTASDNGTVNNGVQGTGTASSAGLVDPGVTGSTYTPPSWLSQITGAVTGLAGTAGAVNTQLAPLIGGVPAAGPGVAGQPVAGTTFSIGGISITPVMLIIGAVVAFLLFRKK
jgi:hypothetical protein